MISGLSKDEELFIADEENQRLRKALAISREALLKLHQVDVLKQMDEALAPAQDQPSWISTLLKTWPALRRRNDDQA